MRGVIKLKSVLLFVVDFFLPSLPAQFYNFA